ncbi:palmitoyl-acyl carrier protein thioesterase, chloroplastic-like [Dorcoceras hygrometricum]|uniref:Palmitoyl-acyl carrier protein thioesterase, chloroplastic-like n=1 Tax=Dorcoceras hygrometricum TaxID=472368 RepID=A0A2Z7BNR7_9LAMI|nr:palmitoyl-acyl carrier protein thioesterase, chloroplastic-like [Dorcoceras hygrometricum]
MKRRRVDISADGLALMTSSMTSSYSADGFREQSQESADSVGRLCVANQSQDPVASYSGSSRKQQQHPVESLYKSAVAIYIQSQALRIQSQALESQTQEKKNHTAEAVVHLRSLGVLTAAGCGIGSVHAVVRSNLLVVDPSEVDEGEIHTVEAVVHLRSLGVLTAAGCGIGSVHAVVRSNLLVVDPSEVEEGEM